MFAISVRRSEMGMIKFKEYHERLIKGVKEVMESRNFQEFLRFSAKFHKYSFGNALLIWGQYPKASHVSGMRTWNSIGRHVRKGEKGIAIFAPLIKKQKDVNDKEPIGSGSPDEKESKRLIGFRAVYVWDIAQIEGKSVPELETETPVMNGDPDQLFNRILQVSPIPVSFEEISGKANGYYVPKEKRIVLSGSLMAEEKSKTLLHELAHHLSFCNYVEGEKADKDRPTEEVIAEGAAFMASAHFDLDSSGYSFPYVASWSKDPEAVLTAGRDIRNIAVQLIEMIEGVVRCESV
jgi:antirestriction protein ArdC